MLNLIETLLGLSGQSPDQIVAVLSNPLHKPITFGDLGLQQFQKLKAERRRVHFLSYSERTRQWSNDSVEEGERLSDDSLAFDDWCDPTTSASKIWALLDHALFDRWIPGTLEIRDASESDRGPEASTA